MTRSRPRRPWALPFVPLYAAASALEARFTRPCALGGLVLSVGSLSAGGAGKTPVVRMLAELLRQHGIPHDVLSRGYGRAGTAPEQVRLTGDGDARRFGDEPVELAQAGIPVFVGRNRLEAGMLAESTVPPENLIHLLDDGFGHRRLHRDLDLVLFTRADALDSLLPAGNLRETFASLSRADAVLLREEEARELVPLVQRHTAAPVWQIRRELLLPATPLRRPFAFCGIARPQGFVDMLQAHPARTFSIAGTQNFRDHHPYTAADIEQLIERARRAGADGFVTTAKDNVKLGASLRTRLETVGAVTVAGLRASLRDEKAFFALLHTAQASRSGLLQRAKIKA